MKKKWLWVYLALTLGWILLIFGFSSQSAEESGGLSAIIVKPLMALFSQFGSPESETEMYSKIDEIIRNIAHFTEYAVLGILLKLLGDCIGAKRIWLPWLVGTVYAITDEWHQSFSPGRACDPKDVLIDSCGVLFGAVFCHFVLKQWRKKHVHDS